MFDLTLAQSLFSKVLRDAYKLDVTSPALKDTPMRMAKMYAELLAHSHQEQPDFDTEFPNDPKYTGIVMSDCLQFWSICEHHFIPFGGMGWIIYIPHIDDSGNGVVAGLSKLERTLHFFSKRPQLQERLTKQVADYITKTYNPEGAMVYLRAKHGCTQCRGVRSSNASGMTTSAVTGVFKTKPELELKALEMIKISLSIERL